jgi:long-chain acyl-CoA synthetase
VVHPTVAREPVAVRSEAGALWKTRGVTESAAPALAPTLALGDEVSTLTEPMTVDAWVKRNAIARPNGVALVQPGSLRRVLTWSELDARVGAVAAGLAHHGLVAGHRLALLGGNSIEFVTGYLAALRAGFVAVPLDPHQSDDDLRARLADTGTRVLLTDGVLSDGVPSDSVLGDAGFEAPGVRSLPLTQAGLDALAAAGSAQVASPADPEALAALLYTAGTSGEPRAVMISQRALVSNLTQMAQLGVLDTDTVLAAALPMSGVFGLVSVLGSWIVSAGTLVVTGRRADLGSLAHDEGITNLPLTPLMILRLLRLEDVRGALAGVSTVVTGGAPLPQAMADDFAQRTGLRIEQGYGLTEAVAVSTTIGGDLLGHGHVGRVLPGIEVRIGDGAEGYEPGEICVRGASLFSGYWPDGRGGPDENGWFATGDIGYLNGTELFWVDRVRDLISVNGFPVYPAEIEQVISELPAVDGVAVIAGPLAAGRREIVAFVSGDELAAEDVMAHCQARLARFKQPSRVILLDELPRGVTGMVQKSALRRRLPSTAEL